ncbi:MAG: EAL domain-containing protein [Sideroxyarcus sp.]|nr:EAL domain-containing protein [Sideroxyarcus sp.]
MEASQSKHQITELPAAQNNQKHRILFVTSALIAVIALFNFNLLSNLYAEIKNTENEIIGLEYTHHIAQTIDNLQQHRGLVAGYLSGSFFLKEAILAKESQIDAQINTVDLLSAKLSFMAGKAEGNDWTLIKTKWRALQKNDPELSIKESFVSHSSLINEAINLTGLVSDYSGLTIDRDLGANHLSDLITYALPSLIEQMGQLRASVMSVAAPQTISNDTKIKLHNLMAPIKGSMIHAYHDLGVMTASNPEFGAKTGKFSQELKQNISNALQLTEKIVSSSSHSIHANQLFSEFSKPTRSGYALLSVANTLITEDLGSRLKRQHNWFYLNLTFTIASIAILVYLSLWVGNSIASGIRRLEQSARKLKFSNHRLHRTIRDLTKAGEQLQLDAQVFRESKDAITITDSQANIITINEAFTRITGYLPEEVVGKNPKILQSGRHGLGFYQNMWACITQQGHWQGEIWNKRKNGEIYPEKLSISAVKNQSQETTHYIAVFRDATNEVKSAEKIQRLAYYDTLTHLPNRILMMDHFELAIAHAKRTSCKCAALFLDMDHFKNINDALGHSLGDQLLVAIATRLREYVREGDTVARMGGDEFVVILTDITESSSAFLVTQKIIQLLSEPYNIEDRIIHVTPSIGISIYPDDGADKETLLMHADVAMYHAKRNGRNDFQFFIPSMKSKVSERLFIESDIRNALEQKQFTLHYQPQVDITTGKIVGAEALVRWNHPVAGFIPPAKFITIAEESGLIIPLGEWILLEACQQNVKWQEAGLAPISIAVNLSAVQFRQKNLCQLIAKALKDTGLEPYYLELELTEGLIMSNADSTINTLNDFKAIGIHLSIDDFGTGYSSLSYLKHFPIDYLKIDQSFIRDITTDPDDAAITTAIINMARSLNLRTIAEGVETAEQLKFLRLHSCDVVQGYYFSKPVPAAEFADILQMSHLSKSLAWQGKLSALDLTH